MAALEILTLLAPLTLGGLAFCAGQARFGWGL